MSLRIGALVPLSRPGWVEAGQSLLAGLELGVEDVNAAGGEPLELLVRDTAADPERAVAAVDELAGLGVVALAGEYHSVVARAVAARADALRLPFLCSSAVLDALTDEPTEWVARLAPPQSRGWGIYADYLKRAGHTKIAVVSQPSVYWAAGIRILREHLTVEDDGATALLVLAGYPEPFTSIVHDVRRRSDILIGAPAGQPEFAAGLAGIPFLRYRPERLGPLGTQVEAALRERLGGAPSFVAFEGYDTIVALADLLRGEGGWARVAVEGSRGPIRFSQIPGIPVWQWDGTPIQVVERDPARPGRFKLSR